MSAEISPEDVVADFFAADGTDYDDSGNGWFHEVKANGNVIEIAITPSDDDGVSTEEPVHFRAVVAPVSEDAMLDGPLDIIGPPGERVLLDLSDFSSLLDLSPEQAYAAAAQLIAAAALSVSSGEADTRG